MTPQIFQSAARVIEAKPALEKLRGATDGFEQAFIKQLVQEMRKSSSNEFGDMPGGQVYEDMSDDILAKSLSNGGHFGISDQMFKQMAPIVMAQSSLQPK
jgi:Rod binding domain-containing protein